MLGKEFCVIIPVYNEASVIKGVVKDLKKFFEFIVCVDDGSNDSSSVEASSAGAVVIRHPINVGQGAALQTGIDYALSKSGTRYFVTFDADGQHKPADASNMAKFLKEQPNNDIVLGSRFLGKTENMGEAKKMLLKLSVIFMNRTSGLKLTDAHNGLRAFNRHVAETLNITMPDYSHASEIISRIVENKYRYREFPVTIAYTEYSTSKGQTLINAVNIGFDVIMRKASKK